MDILVTTPLSQSENAKHEANNILTDGGGYYFRTLHSYPSRTKVGDRVFYVEDGYIRGFAKITEIVNGHKTCETTGRDWGYGYHVVMDATTWQWIRPIPLKGFQGFRYFVPPPDIEIVGGWRDPKPEVR